MKIILVSVFIVFLIFQFYRPELPNPGVTGDINVPNDIKQILIKSCYNCHSNETQIPWFDNINPAYLIVRSHVLNGRSFLNFSEWEMHNKAKQKVLLFDVLNVVKTFQTMPLPEYTFLHPEAKLSGNEIDKLEKFILSFEQNEIEQNNTIQNKVNKKLNIPKVKKALNGIEYIQDYKNWQVISTSERFDHNSTRIIYANNIAINAINEGKNNPYPDGSILAKEVWKRMVNEIGDIVPGNFIHVEFMIKNDKKYKSTKGWGWARWIGNDLEPFGTDKDFSNTCINCHKPLENTDYVFTPAIKFSKNKLMDFIR